MTNRFFAIVFILFAFTMAWAQGEPVGEIVIKGTKNIAEATIRALMQTKEGQIYQAGQLPKDKATLDGLGFFKTVQVYGQFMDTGKWRVVVEVVEWPKVKAINITGNTIFTDEELGAILKTKVGEVFNIRNLDSDAKAIQDKYRGSNGFGHVSKYEPSDADAEIIDIEITEVKVGTIEFKGLVSTKKRVLDKLMDTKPGKLFNITTFGDDLRRIYDTGWFEELKPDTSEPKLGVVDIIITLKETRTGNFNVGAQLDPRNRLAGLLTIQETNWRGTGQSVGINFSQSTQGLGTSIELSYGNPFMDNRRSSFNASIYSKESLVFGSSLFGGGGSPTGTSFSQRRNGISFGISRVIRKDTRFSIGLRGELISSTDVALDPGEQFVVQDGTTFGLDLGFTRNRRDNSQDPSRGDWLRATVEPTLAHITSVSGITTGFDILGDNPYVRTTVDYRVYFSSGKPRTPDKLDEPRRVLALRAYGGHISGQVPFSDQFFVGGANGVRGYSESRFWGRTSMLLQAEYRYPIQKSFNLIGFFDYGGAWNGYPGIKEFTQSDTAELSFGYGFGVNFKTAFGPIRIDFGFDKSGKSRTHFLIGGSF